MDRVRKRYRWDTTPRSSGTQSKKTVRGFFLIQVGGSIILKQGKKKKNLLETGTSIPSCSSMIKVIYFRLDNDFSL